jgi:hypothetical protein
MFDPEKQLLSSMVATTVAELTANAADPEPWDRLRRVLEPSRGNEKELAAWVEAKDLAALRAVLAEWSANKRMLPVQDREVLRRAMKAFRKSLKVTRLDAESSIGGGPMSSGRHSEILGMRPPDRYPREVWEELARQGKLVARGHGIYELGKD